MHTPLEDCSWNMPIKPADTDLKPPAAANTAETAARMCSTIELSLSHSQASHPAKSSMHIWLRRPFRLLIEPLDIGKCAFDIELNFGGTISTMLFVRTRYTCWSALEELIHSKAACGRSESLVPLSEQRLPTQTRYGTMAGIEDRLGN